jgi:DNA helicase HerA-like ATPase
MGRQREVTLIFGRTGSGKSTLAKSLIGNSKRVIVFDRLEEYKGGLVIETFSEFVKYFSEEPETFFVVCRFPHLTSYEFTAEALFSIKDTLVVLEECDLYLSSVSFNDPDNSFNALVTRGRHAGISILAITQRPHLIAITLRAMATEAITFVQHEPRDLGYLESWGFDPEEVSQLPEFKSVSLSGKDYNVAFHG